jgi:hypothetical protein
MNPSHETVNDHLQSLPGFLAQATSITDNLPFGGTMFLVEKDMLRRTIAENPALAKVRCTLNFFWSVGPMNSKSWLSIAIVIAVLFSLPSTVLGASAGHFVVTNDDSFKANTASFYLSDAENGIPKLTKTGVVTTGGRGLGGGYFAGLGVVLVHAGAEQCVFVADSGTSDVAGIILPSQQVSGTFRGSKQDDGGLNGVTLAASNTYLYASFTGSYTIATFRIEPGCKLHWVRDISAVGMGLGTVGPMAVHGNILVVSFGDSTIESFDISGGSPVPNGDEQLSTGSKNGNLPSGIDITQDGHYAIFGDVTSTTTVEVSDMSSGKLTPTVVYSVGNADANNVRLSPDESLLYITNNKRGTVTAAFFDKATGAVSPGCVSDVLRGFNTGWFYDAGLINTSNSGTGGTLFVAEDGPQSAIATVNVTVTNGTCTLTEAPNSPVADSSSQALRSLAGYPPRPF